MLIDAIAALPPSPGTMYRTFWLDKLEDFVALLRVGQIEMSAFTSTSRIRHVANKFNGNVQLTIQGHSGRDIAPYSDAPHEAETLFLPGLMFRVTRVRVKKTDGRIGHVEAELIEL